MSSYLDAYGAAEEKRVQKIKLIKICSIVLVVVAGIGLVLYAIFKNYGQEAQAKSFVALLQSHDYKGAYALWGCTDARPCRDYPMDKFMSDWGPQSPHADQSTAKIAVSQSCGGGGVLIRLEYPNGVEPVPLWVERDTKIISFAPWPECPGRHLHVGAWLRSLFH